MMKREPVSSEDINRPGPYGNSLLNMAKDGFQVKNFTNSSVKIGKSFIYFCVLLNL